MHKLAYFNILIYKQTHVLSAQNAWWYYVTS